MPDPNDADFEGQDLAEVFDEENITPDGRDIATSDMERDVFDVTSVDEDATEALEPDDDFDPDAADEAELEEILLADEDLDEPRSFRRDDADLVAADDPRPADFEAKSLSDEDAEALDAALDEGLKDTFPASDPVAVSRRAR